MQDSGIKDTRSSLKAARKKTEKQKKDKKETKKKSQAKQGGRRLGGLLFAKMMRGGASELSANAQKVNSLNVFPVPDGDTGDNMRMTIESGIRAIENNDSDNLAQVMRAVSRGMLLGARGNSGVILSQFFAGIAKGFENSATADAAALGDALRCGVSQAYTSVMTPTEGTILTVAREAVDFAVSRLTPKSTVRTLFSDLVGEMYRAVERTPEALAVLKEAGVVDSGGAGLFYIMDGLNRVLRGEEISDYHEGQPQESSTPLSLRFDAESEMKYGYCTELLLQLMKSKTDIETFDIEDIKRHLSELGDSVVAVKTDSIVKIHVHSFSPEAVLTYMHDFGEFISLKIENMSVQHTGVSRENSAQSTIKKKYGIVAVSSGEGFSRIFKELGADEIVEGSQGANPATSDFIDAFQRINAENIFVLPNNKNITMAAAQAADIYKDAKIHVLPVTTMGAGYVALSSIDIDSESAEDIIAAVSEAVNGICNAYISPAVRDTDINGIHVTEGDTIGVINKEIVLSLPDPEAAARGLVDNLLSGGERYMLTVFAGKEASADWLSSFEDYVKSSYPEVEFYLLDGGQQIYPFIIVAE